MYFAPACLKPTLALAAGKCLCGHHNGSQQTARYVPGNRTALRNSVLDKPDRGSLHQSWSHLQVLQPWQMHTPSWF